MAASLLQRHEIAPRTLCPVTAPGLHGALDNLVG
jgi:hypothetical protein